MSIWLYSKKAHLHFREFIFKNENKSKAFILAPGHHIPTQKVSKWIKPTSLWDGLKTQSAGEDTKEARISESQSTNESAHGREAIYWDFLLCSHISTKMKHETITPRYQCQIISNSVMQQSFPPSYAQQWARPAGGFREVNGLVVQLGRWTKYYMKDD